MIKHIPNMRGAAVVWLVSYIFFLVTLANNFSASHDSINYLLHITRGEHLFHQHHLLYHFVANKWLSVFSNVFISAPHHYIIEAFTACWGSLNLAVCYLILRNRFNVKLLLAVAGIAAIAFSFGTWFYSVNIEVYAPPVFFMLCALYVITGKDFHSSQVGTVAVLQSFAILFHQLNVLFIVVVIYWIATRCGRSGLIIYFSRYAVIGIVICGAAYFYAGWFAEGHSNVNDFANWVLGYTKGHTYWRGLSLKTPLDAGVGFARAFTGGHFIFEHPFLQQKLQESFAAHRLSDEMFLVKDISKKMVWLLTILAVVFFLLLLTLVVRFIAKYRNMSLHFHVINPIIITIVVYSLFFCFWMPEILEFWIFQMILVWLLIVGMMPAYRFPLRLPAATGIAILAVCLFVINYFGSVRWLMNINYDYYNAEVKQLDSTLTKEDIVVVGDEWILKDYVRYYTNATVIATDDPVFSRANVLKEISVAIISGHKVVIYKKDNASGKRWTVIRAY